MAEQFFKELAALRKSNNIEIEEISERTKINPRYFEAIEKGDFEVLPNVYMRLFLRSYAIEIGADAEKILEDYELYTTGKISEKVDVRKAAAVKSDVDPEDPEESDISPYDFRRKIIYGVIAVVTLLVLIKFVVYLLEEQRTDVPPTPIEEIADDGALSEEPAELDLQPQFSELPPASERPESVVYSSDKSLRKISRRLPVSAPYNLNVLALARTKVHISSPTRSLFNDIMNAGEEREFTFTDTIRFDIWSAQHVNVTLNSLDLSQNQILSHEDVAVRASIVSDGSLAAEFFQH